MLHNLRIFKQEMHLIANGRGEGKGIGDKILLKYISDNRFIFKAKISIFVMAVADSERCCLELKYKPNHSEWGVLKRFLSERGLVVKSTGKNRYGGLEGIYHFSGCTIHLELTSKNNLDVKVISDSKRRAKKTADELDYRVIIHDLSSSRQGLY